MGVAKTLTPPANLLMPPGWLRWVPLCRLLWLPTHPGLHIATDKQEVLLGLTEL